GLAFHRRSLRPANQAVDRHPVRDRPQPAAERLRRAELIELGEGLNEHVLRELLSLGVVAEPAERDRQHVPLVPLEQLAERLTAALLSLQNELNRPELVGVLVVIESDGHGGSPSCLTEGSQGTRWSCGARKSKQSEES